jgi:hypothetical protein
MARTPFACLALTSVAAAIAGMAAIAAAPPAAGGKQVVMAGLVPAIHVFTADEGRRGCPHARA